MARANWPETEVSIVLFSNPWTIQHSFATESWLLVPVVRIVEVLSIFWCSSSVPTIEFYSQLLYLFIDFIASTAPQVDRFQHAKSHIVPSAHHGQRRFWFLEAPSPIRKLQMSRQDRWDHSHWTKLSSFLFFWAISRFSSQPDHNLRLTRRSSLSELGQLRSSQPGLRPNIRAAKVEGKSRQYRSIYPRMIKLSLKSRGGK